MWWEKRGIAFADGAVTEMKNFDLNDTIAAIATGVGESGIGIVRISGKDSLNIAERIFLSKDGRKPSDFKAYTVHYGWIVDRRTPYNVQCTLKDNNLIPNTQHAQQNIIDEVLLTVMRAPRSYTKEDVVEISCHGGIVAIRAVLDLVLASGARLAQAGEFTKRAFLNGRIDLAQAEAVLDIIRAKTDSALRIGAQQLKGRLSQEINKIRNTLLNILSLLEANIDFPEEEISRADLENIGKKLEGADKELKDILISSQQGKVLREGVNVVICGKPNAGKSSLLNALLKQERSIVTPIAGTTRDTVEEIIDIRGIPVRIADTAGIIEPRDLIEKKAIQRTKKYITCADLVILMLDSSRKLDNGDRALLKRLKGKRVLGVINKIDLKPKMRKEQVSEIFSHVIEISAKKLKNIKQLEDAIADLVYHGKVPAAEPAIVSKLRHIESLRQAQKFVAEAIDSLDNKLSLEFIAQSVKDALERLDEISGRVFSQDLLDKIFSEFCIGK